MGNLIRISAAALCVMALGLGSMQAQGNGGIPAPNGRLNNSSSVNNGKSNAAANRNNNKNRYNSDNRNGNGRIDDNRKNGGSQYRNNVPNRGIDRPQAGVSRPQNPMTPDPRKRYDGGARGNGIARPNYVAGTPISPPMRQYRPRVIAAPRPIARPSNYLHSRRVEYINNVLGLTFYSDVSQGLNYLYDNHFYIDGYDDNTVYLRNVAQLDYNWDDVYLNYTSGGLTSAQFVYSTSGDDESRYNSVYYMLCARYSDPVILNYNSRSPRGTAAWYGNGYKNYVTLDYYIDYATNGHRRYYTVLTYCTNLDRNTIY